MIPYWFLFGFFALGALLEGGRSGQRVFSPLALSVGVLLIILMIGFRFRVGADWYAYDFMLEFARYVRLTRLLSYGDPGYMFLNFVVAEFHAGLWLVNLMCGIIFAWGLTRFALVQENPWLTILVAVPYLIIVVAMGYSRQAVAIGILMAGLAGYTKHASVVRFALYVAAAALFHKTAVVAMPLVALASRRNLLVNLLIALAAAYLLYDLFLSDSMDRFMQGYVRRGYSSQGAGIRVGMNTVAALLFLAYPKQFGFPDIERQIWRNFSLVALVLLVLLIVTPSSTAVDRISLYIIPLQLAVLSRVPAHFSRRLFGYGLITAYCFTVSFTWLNFAVHSRYWVPYQIYPVWDQSPPPQRHRF